MIKLLFAWIIFHIGLFLLSYINIKDSLDNFEFIYKWGFVFGAYVWEDLFVFSLFNILTAFITLILRDLRVGLLLLTIFGVVRAAGETFYFFLQQFIQPKFSPHNVEEHFTLFKYIFGEISEQKVFIIMQVFHQTVMVFFIAAIIVLLIRWRHIPKSF